MNSKVTDSNMRKLCHVLLCIKILLINMKLFDDIKFCLKNRIWIFPVYLSKESRNKLESPFVVCSVLTESQNFLRKDWAVVFEPLIWALAGGGFVVDGFSALQPLAVGFCGNAKEVVLCLWPVSWVSSVKTVVSLGLSLPRTLHLLDLGSIQTLCAMPFLVAFVTGAMYYRKQKRKLQSQAVLFNAALSVL